MGPKEGTYQMPGNCFMTLAEMAKVTGGRLLGPDRPVGPAIKSDSRKVDRGDGFIALPGAKDDGHIYVAGAIARGACFVIMEEGKAGEKVLNESREKVSFLLVKNTPKALKDAAAHLFLRKAALDEIVAITGTVGKTTTRECIAAVLRKRYRVHAARESYNTWIGCALSILEMPLDTEILILEMGTNHPGEILEMAQSYPPTTAVITAIGPGHLEGLTDLDGVLEAKMEILHSSRLKRVLYNADSEILENRLCSGNFPFDLFPVGFGKGTYLLREGGFSFEQDTIKTKIEIAKEDKRLLFSSYLFGPQHAYAMGFSIACGDLFNVEHLQVVEAIEQVRPLPGRGITGKSSRGVWYIDETYNANPLSMWQALVNLKSLKLKPGGRKCAVLGGMKELGKETSRLHRDVLDFAKDLDFVVLIGDEWTKALGSQDGKKTFRYYHDAAGVAPLLDGELAPGDMVLLKGSRAYGLEKILKEAGCLA